MYATILVTQLTSPLTLTVVGCIKASLSLSLHVCLCVFIPIIFLDFPDRVVHFQNPTTPFPIMEYDSTV